MQLKLHKNATTTPAIRKIIQQSNLSSYALAKQFNISLSTVLRWKKRKTIDDKSSRPLKLNTTLTKIQEELICFERKQYKKPIDEIYLSLKDIIPNLYPMKIYRCLKRYGLDKLPEEFKKEENRIKKFKNYGIGYLHIDVLYSPKINGIRKYIFTCIDRISKIAYIKLFDSKDKYTSLYFLKQVLSFYPYKINYILTDNGSEFSYKGYYQKHKIKSPHPFDKTCQDNNINHRTIKFYHPWTNGMIERFNQTIKNKVLKKYIFFSDIFSLKEKLIEFINNYNFNTKLKSLNYKSPAEYIKDIKGIILQRIVS